MKKIANMNLKELRQASVEIERAKAAAKQKERDRVRAEAEKLAAASGMTLAELVGTRKKRAKKPRIFNPSDKTQSYGGYGPKPAWLKELEALDKSGPAKFTANDIQGYKTAMQAERARRNKGKAA